MQKCLIYQVLPRFWKNGRFSSWGTPEFEYLKGLNVTHLWLTGIIRHASGESFVKGDPGCPYSICNYYDINPYLADNADNRISEFKNLINRAHRAGIKVLIDFVPNHIACNYADEYGGIPHFDHCDYDWTDTRKINYSDPRTADAMISILRYWAKLGVDGFRCDMVELVDVGFFGYSISALKAEYPELLFVAEVYDTANYSRYVEVGKFDLLYDKSGTYDILRSVLCHGAPAFGLTWNWQRLGQLQGRMLNFLENHDEQRVASPCFLGDPSKAYAALAFEALFNDASMMIYSGQEVGEDASGSDNGRTSIFNHTHVNVMEIHSGSPVYDRYVEILSHLSLPAFSIGGNWDLGYFLDTSDGFDASHHFAFLRYSSDSCWAVLCNFSDSPATVRIRIPSEVPIGSGLSALLTALPFDAAFARIA